jgi:fatty-acyl-CoA synthase
VAFIQHSAGTTGLQKGVALTHTAVLRQLEHLSQGLKIDRATRPDLQLAASLSRHGPDRLLHACPWFATYRVVMQSPLDWVMHPETMLQVISEHKCTLAWLPNFAFQFVPRRTNGRAGGRSMICLLFAR